MPADNFYSPDGKPWCHFEFGIWCINGSRCKNPHHRKPPENKDDRHGSGTAR